MKFGEQNGCLRYSSPTAIMGKKKGNIFRRLRGQSYFSLKKDCGSRNIKIFINIFFSPLYGAWFEDRVLKLKLLRCVVEGGQAIMEREGKSFFT